MKKLIHLFYDHPLGAEESHLFVNRKNALDLISEAIAGAREGQIENYAILGEEGMGKSSLINRAYEDARISKEVLPLRLEITEETNEFIFFKELCRQLVNGIQIGLFDRLSYLIRRGEDVNKLVEDITGLISGITKSEELSTQFSFGILNLVQFSLGRGKGEVRAPPLDVTEIIGIVDNLKRFLSLKYKTVIVFIDEAGYVASEKSRSLLQRMRLFFQTKPFMTIIAGNPRLIDELTKVVPDVANMFPEGNRILLDPLAEQHVEELIESRVIGENPLRDPDVITAIWRESGATPRYIIRICRESIRILQRRKESTVTIEMIIEASMRISAIKGRDIFNKLSEPQQELVIQLYREGGSSYPSMLAEKLKKTQGRISQILSELYDLGYVRRKAEGRKVVYSLCKALFSYIQQMVS